MSGIDPEIVLACDRTTIGGLHVTYDDGHLRPYVQVSGVLRPSYEARVVCPVCHVATARVWHDPAYVLGTDENVTRDLAIEKAVKRWNERKGSDDHGA